VSGAARANPIAKIEQVSHQALEVRDLDRSIAFYEAVLGLEIFHDDRANPEGPSIKGCVAGFGIELAQVAAPADAEPSAGAATPCLSFSVTNIDEAFARLRALGWVTAAAPTRFRGVSYFTIRDPDGFAIELIEFPWPVRTLSDLRFKPLA
jgi:catechol 2,3-dioxygenase-like lactoylglutathione lyase family enzyme